MYCRGCMHIASYKITCVIWSLNPLTDFPPITPMAYSWFTACTTHPRLTTYFIIYSGKQLHLFVHTHSFSMQVRTITITNLPSYLPTHCRGTITIRHAIIHIAIWFHSFCRFIIDSFNGQLSSCWISGQLRKVWHSTLTGMHRTKSWTYSCVVQKNGRKYHISGTWKLQGAIG